MEQVFFGARGVKKYVLLYVKDIRKRSLTIIDGWAIKL